MLQPKQRNCTESDGRDLQEYRMTCDEEDE